MVFVSRSTSITFYSFKCLLCMRSHGYLCYLHLSGRNNLSRFWDRVKYGIPKSSTKPEYGNLSIIIFYIFLGYPIGCVTVIEVMVDGDEIWKYGYLLFIVVFYQSSVPYFLDGFHYYCYFKDIPIWDSESWCSRTGWLFHWLHTLQLWKYFVWLWCWWGGSEMR